MTDEFLLKQLQDLLQQRCGLRFPENQVVDFIRGLTAAMHASGHQDLAAYYNDLLLSPATSPLWKHLVEELTIGETYFFRDVWQFKALREHILPGIIEQRRRAGQLYLRIWSAGCSTGEEAYSLAILLRELLPDLDQWNLLILATDINEQSLGKAQMAHYSSWSFRLETPLAIRDRYFIEHAHSYELLPLVRQMVSFQYLNLVEDLYPSLMTNTQNMDLILCRNVTIYFDRSTTKKVVDRFHQALVPEGWLVVGHSEPLPSIYAEYQLQNFEHAIAYRRPLVKNTGPSPAPKPAPTPLLTPKVSPPSVPSPHKLSDHEQQERMEAIYKLMAKRDLPKARESLSHFLELMPDHIDALCLLAKLAADEGQNQVVHQILDTIDNINPLLPQSHYLRALIYQQSEAWSEAKSALRRALYADRQFALAHYYMGEILFVEGNLALAHRSWENALNLLSKQAPERPVPFGDGMLTGTLIHAIEQRLNIR